MHAYMHTCTHTHTHIHTHTDTDAGNETETCKRNCWSDSRYQYNVVESLGFRV